MAGIYDERILGAKQQAETARKLREGIQTPEGQMVSGHYVAPNITQYLGNLLRSYQSGSQERAAMEQAKQLEQQKQQEIADIQGQLGPQAQSVVGAEGPQLPIRQPTEQERMAALLRGQAVAPEVFQPQVQMEQWQQGQQAKQEAQQAALEDKKARREWEAQQRKDAQQAQFAQQKEMARLAAALRPAPQEKMIVVADKEGNPVYVPQSQAMGQTQWNPKLAGQIDQRKTSALTAQQALDQAAELYAHPGREAGTGASYWMQNIPATEAKGFGSSLETFKAKTFLDAVQAMKGLGALTEQEGAKLVASVGSLDPSMKESEFAANLQKATRDMYEKAKAKGLDVNLPSFAAQAGKQPAQAGKVRRFNPATGRLE